MADTKISALTALTGANALGTDIIPIVDLSEADATKNKKISLDELKKQGTIFTDLSGTAWDGTYRTKTLTANTALTFSSTLKSGLLIVTQDGTGSRTLSINGTAITINTAAGSKSSISFIYDEVNAAYVFFFDLNVTALGGGDVTAPTRVSMIISDAEDTRIYITYNESLNDTSVPVAGDFAILKNGGAVVPTSVDVTGLTVVLEFASPFVTSDVVTASYTPGTNKIEDAAGNDAASFSAQAVTNNVVGGVTIAGTAWNSYFKINAGEHTLRVAGDSFVEKIWDQMDAIWPQYPTSNDMVMRQVTEANQPKYIASGINGTPSIEFDTTAKWLETVAIDIYTKPVTRIAVVQFKSLPAAFRYFLYNRSGSARADVGHDDTGKLFMYGGAVATGTTTLVVDTKYIIWAEFKTDGTSKLYLNGTLEIGPVTAGAMTEFYHGRLGTDATTSANIWLGDNFVYEGIFSDADRATLTTELKTKYGIA